MLWSMQCLNQEPYQRTGRSLSGRGDHYLIGYTACRSDAPTKDLPGRHWTSCEEFSQDARNAPEIGRELSAYVADDERIYSDA
jgi:hypothetical protein